ncbi:hypothetical protein AB1L30_05235 [Bremerella sp. JC817]|uniref:hypothetical protein n=1 Tax=Bremerella sp. JC817 TaxID=3231756 RepID=UPI00345A41B2
MTHSTASYDDDAELSSYIWRHYTSLLTEIERKANKAILAEQKAEAADPSMANHLRARWGIRNDPQVIAALRDGPDTFRRRVSERIMREVPQQVFINRCPACQRIVQTPKAQQCLWCGCNWHGDPTS